MLRMEMISFSLEHQLRCLNRQLQASWQGDTDFFDIYILYAISAQFQLFQRMVVKVCGLQDMT